MPRNFRSHTCILSAGLLLTGCVSTTLARTAPGDVDRGIRRDVVVSLGALRALVDGLADPADLEPLPIAEAAAGLDAARSTVFAAAIAGLDTNASPAARAELATLGVLLTICRDRVRAAAAHPPGSDAARTAGRGLAIGCVTPLAIALGA